MPDQFVVPQFIETEDTFFGPVTGRQFVIMMVVGLTEVLFWQLFSFVWFLIIGIPFLTFGGIVAFVKINGQPFHFFILNLIQTLKKPRLRVWQKRHTDADLKAYMNMQPPAPEQPFTRKQFASSSHLQELSLVVNTGGVYKPEE